MCCIKIAPICVLIWVTGVKSGTGRPSSDHLQISTILLTLVLYIVRMLTMNYCIQENMYILELKLFISLSSSHLNAGDHAWNTYFEFVLNMLLFKELIGYLN